MTSSPTDEYCNICNWAQYSTEHHDEPGERAAHLQDTRESLYGDSAAATLPAVS